MSSNHSTAKSVASGVVLGLVTLMAIAAVYSWRNPTSIEQLLALVIVGRIDELKVDDSQEMRLDAIDEKQSGSTDIAQALLAVESPSARLALVKSYIEEFRALLTPTSQKELDAIIVFVDQNPVVLDDLSLLPASYSASLTTIRQELQRALGVVTAVYSELDETTSSPSAARVTPVVGQAYTLTGDLALVESDDILGGTTFVMTNTNYGEPFYLYLTGSQVPVIKETMVGQTVTVEVEVTSIEEGFVRYLVLTGPFLATDSTGTSPVATQSAAGADLSE